MVALGLWLFFSPYFVRYVSVSGIAAWNAYVVGGAITVLAAWALVSRNTWTEWANLVLAIWLIAAPFVLRFIEAELIASAYQIALGVLMIAGTTWALFRAAKTKRAEQT